MSMPASGSHYSQSKTSNRLLFKQKSECVVQRQQYKMDMERWHGAIPSCLVEEKYFGKAGREKVINNIFERHEVKVKMPSAVMWVIERREQEAGMRYIDIW